jgi:hypothetical protein
MPPTHSIKCTARTLGAAFLPQKGHKKMSRSLPSSVVPTSGQLQQQPPPGEPPLPSSGAQQLGPALGPLLLRLRRRLPPRSAATPAPAPAACPGRGSAALQWSAPPQCLASSSSCCTAGSAAPPIGSRQQSFAQLFAAAESCGALRCRIAECGRKACTKLDLSAQQRAQTLAHGTQKKPALGSGPLATGPSGAYG